MRHIVFKKFHRHLLWSTTWFNRSLCGLIVISRKETVENVRKRAYNFSMIVYRSKAQKDSLWLPWGGAEERALIPHPANMISQLFGLCNIIKAWGNRHILHWPSLEKEKMLIEYFSDTIPSMYSMQKCSKSNTIFMTETSVIRHMLNQNFHTVHIDNV